MQEPPSIFDRFDPPLTPPLELVAEAPERLCSCERPIPRERALQKWIVRTYCARCELPLPLRLEGGRC